MKDTIFVTMATTNDKEISLLVYESDDIIHEMVGEIPTIRCNDKVYDYVDDDAKAFIQDMLNDDTFESYDYYEIDTLLYE